METEEFSTSLRKFRQRAGLTQEETAGHLGISPNYVYLLESGKKRPSETVLKLFATLLTSPLFPTGDPHSGRVVDEPEEIVSYDTERPVSLLSDREAEYGGKEVPARGRARDISVLSMAQCGQVTDFDELPLEWQRALASDCPDPKAFALELRGDSMEPYFRAGELAIVMPNFKPRLHDYVVVRLNDGGVLFKIFGVEQSGETPRIRLSSHNSAYDPLLLVDEDITWIRPVWGVFRKLREI